MDKIFLKAFNWIQRTLLKVIEKGEALTSSEVSAPDDGNRFWHSLKDENSYSDINYRKKWVLIKRDNCKKMLT